MSCEICLPLAITLELQGKREKILVTGCYTFNMMKKMFHISPNPPLSKILFFLMDIYLKYEGCWVFPPHLGFLISFFNQSHPKLLTSYLTQRAKIRKENKQNKQWHFLPSKLRSHLGHKISNQSRKVP